MKKYLLLIVLLVAGCQSKSNNRERIEAAVKEALQKTMNDPSVYDPVSFKIDTIQVVGDRVRSTYRVTHVYRNKFNNADVRTLHFEVVQFGDDDPLVTKFEELDK